MGLLVGLPLKLFHILFVVLRFAWPVVLILVIRWAIKRIRNQRIAPDWNATAKQEKEPDFKGPVYTVRYEDVQTPSVSAQPDAPRLKRSSSSPASPRARRLSSLASRPLVYMC